MTAELEVADGHVLSLLVTCSYRNEVIRVMKVHVVFSLNVTGSFADDIIRAVSSVRYRPLWY